MVWDRDSIASRVAPDAPRVPSGATVRADAPELEESRHEPVPRPRGRRTRRMMSAAAGMELEARFASADVAEPDLADGGVLAEPRRCTRPCRRRRWSGRSSPRRRRPARLRPSPGLISWRPTMSLPIRPLQRAASGSPSSRPGPTIEVGPPIAADDRVAETLPERSESPRTAGIRNSQIGSSTRGTAGTSALDRADGPARAEPRRDLPGDHGVPVGAGRVRDDDHVHGRVLPGRAARTSPPNALDVSVRQLALEPAPRRLRRDPLLAHVIERQVRWSMRGRDEQDRDRRSR